MRSQVPGNSVAAALPRRLPSPERTRHLTVLGILCFLCGLTIEFKLDFLGDLYLIEPVVLVLAFQCLLSSGGGKAFVPRLFFGFIAAGLLTFLGYLLSDLAAANDPWQYLRGWARVGFLITDTVALLVLAAHGRQNIWWLLLGAGVGGIVALAIGGAPISQWKSGYGEYAAILVVALAPLLPRVFGAAIVGALGALCVVLDYRSLGAICLIVAIVMLWQPGNRNRGSVLRWVWLGIAGAIASVLIFEVIDATQELYADRREQSNVGRYVGLVVAWRAIAESPVLGYGSWAANDKFSRMYREESEKMRRDRRHPREQSTRSIMPHSQLLQSWLEGGVLGATFFVLYGIHLLRSLYWIALRRHADLVGPLFLYIQMHALWHLFFSPFLGLHRVRIAIAIGIIGVVVHEMRAARKRRMGPRGQPTGAAPAPAAKPALKLKPG